jgi:hypothetical protein
LPNDKNIDIDSTKEIIKVVEAYDKKVISFMLDIEKSLATLIAKKFGNNINCCTNKKDDCINKEETANTEMTKQRNNIKKWWE